MNLQNLFLMAILYNFYLYKFLPWGVNQLSNTEKEEIGGFSNFNYVDAQMHLVLHSRTPIFTPLTIARDYADSLIKVITQHY